MCVVLRFFLGGVVQFLAQVKLATLSLYIKKAPRLLLQSFLCTKAWLWEFSLFFCCVVLLLLVLVVSHCFVAGLCTPLFYFALGTSVPRFVRWCFSFRKGVLWNWKMHYFLRPHLPLCGSGSSVCEWHSLYMALTPLVPGNESGSSPGPRGWLARLGGKAQQNCVAECFHYSPSVSNFTMVSFISFSIWAWTVS